MNPFISVQKEADFSSSSGVSSTELDDASTKSELWKMYDSYAIIVLFS